MYLRKQIPQKQPRDGKSAMCFYTRYKYQCVKCSKALSTEDLVSSPCRNRGCRRRLEDIEATVISKLESCAACEKAGKQDS